MPDARNTAIVRLFEELATAPSLLHYVLASPSYESGERDGRWVMQGNFVDDEGTMHHVTVDDEDFLTTVFAFVDAVNDYLGAGDDDA